MPLQNLIYQLEAGQGAKVLRVVAALLAFVAVAALYDVFCFENFPSEEAMENAQLARNFSQGKGYTTDSIRPLALYLLETAAPAGQSSKVLSKLVPDITNPPVYPVLVAGLMKILPFKFKATQPWSYQPELWIDVFNQFLLCAAAVLLFFVARSLFDSRVAWLAAILFGATRLLWRFSLSGLGTIWLILLFLGIVWCLAVIERQTRGEEPEETPPSLMPAIFVGVLAGLAGLSRYALVWLIVPILLFVWFSAARSRVKLCLAIFASFLVLAAPWLTRNFLISGHVFGTASYAVAQDTPAFEGDKMERTTDPSGGLTRVAPDDVLHKLGSNARDIFSEELPRLGGNWISAFFLVGLFIPFRKPALRKMRWFAVGSILLLIVAEAVSRTHVSADSPVVNSENLLMVTSPLIFMFGAAFFHTLLDQFNLPPTDGRTVMAVFIIALGAPLWLGLFSGRRIDSDSPYAPRHIQQAAHFMQENELTTSDIPSGVAWYGERPCVWLPLDDENEFYKVNALKPIKALFLTQATTNKRFLSEMEEDQRSWSHFVLECWDRGEVPAGFPLRKAPSPRGFLPEQLFLSDKVRWEGDSASH
jgi:hypothetical protein